jgi:hypothetical protein
MILVGCSAVSLAAFRSSAEPGIFIADDWAMAIHAYAALSLMLASILVLILRLRRPRPPLRRIARQPGAVACFSMVAYGLSCHALYILRDPRLGGWPWNMSVGQWIWFLLDNQEFSWNVVAVVWIIFAAGRIGRPEAGWIDRAGRVVGWGWIVWGLAGLFR